MYITAFRTTPAYPFLNTEPAISMSLPIKYCSMSAAAYESTTSAMFIDTSWFSFRRSFAAIRVVICGTVVADSVIGVPVDTREVKSPLSNVFAAFRTSAKHLKSRSCATLCATSCPMFSPGLSGPACVTSPSEIRNTASFSRLIVNSSELSEIVSIVESAPRVTSRTTTPEMSNATRSTLSPNRRVGSKRVFIISLDTSVFRNVSW